MKTRLALLLAILLLAAQSYAWHIDKQCRKYLGWELYRLFPATCHAAMDISTLQELQRIFDKPPFLEEHWIFL